MRRPVKFLLIGVAAFVAVTFVLAGVFLTSGADSVGPVGEATQPAVPVESFIPSAQ